MNNDNGSGNADMNIRRFVAENSRAALRQVKEALGGDAIILANRSVDGGVEVLAAAPGAVDALTRSLTAPPVASSIASLAPATPTELGLRRAAEAASAPTAVLAVGRKRLASLFSRRTQTEAAAPTFAEQTTAMSVPSAMQRTTAAKAIDSYASFADELAAASQGDEDFVMRLAPEAVARSLPAPAVAQTTVTAAAIPEVVTAQEPVVAPQSIEVPVPVAPTAATPGAVDRSADVADLIAREVQREVGEATRDLTRDVTREIRAMQATLSEQLTTLTWTDAMRRQPARTKLMQDLIVAGFSPSLARHIQGRLPDDYGNDEARAWVESILRRNLPVATDAEELISEGGVFALVGPTGVGKTTTVAKLAARFAMKHGVDQLALITTDGFRIGAQDQLRIYGKILGVAVHSIHDEVSLTSAIAHLKDKKLVLIDTAGMSQRDERVAEQIAMLRGAKAKRLVVLNATADAETLDHVVATFADREFAGCVITKTDEAARLGPVLDAVIRHRLRIHHVSTGQKVPEDLERPDAANLVSRALTRPAARPAFDVQPDDEPAWMAAMAGRAQSLTLAFDVVGPSAGTGRA